MGQAGKGAEGRYASLGHVSFTVLLTLSVSVPTTILMVLVFRCGTQGLFSSSQLAQPSGSAVVTGESWGPSQTSKPAAHLTGIEQEMSVGVPHSETEGTLSWEPARGPAFTRDSVRYRGRSLVIPRAGLYYIYCQVGFRGSGCEEGEKPLALSHRVYGRHDSYPQPILLLTGQETVCGARRGRGLWYTTLGQGATVELDKDHHLYVNVSDPNLVDYQEGKTFFGVIMV
ncbi:lymphotoxin-beta-like [Leucoraja erinacea]|uniref:lymphotoxin-beta-like n=1 Tax=Leucoraja erinaceus TaxID=7782 RepID=UPI002454923C|nr:lymphotoxin-beta-like [Leucoraja erinacea]